MPFAYHSRDNVTDVIRGLIDTSKSKNETIGCTWELGVMKSFCQDLRDTISVPSCPDPRFQNFLVNVYGTPVFEQAYVTQKAALIAQQPKLRPCPLGQLWSDVDQKCWTEPKLEIPAT